MLKNEKRILFSNLKNKIAVMSDIASIVHSPEKFSMESIESFISKNQDSFCEEFPFLKPEEILNFFSEIPSELRGFIDSTFSKYYTLDV